MPTITFTLTGDQATRLAAAFGRILNDDGSPATLTQFKGWMITQVKQVLKQDALRQRQAEVRQQARADLVAEGWEAIG